MDHVVVVSLVVKANSLDDAKAETIMNMTRWINDPDTRRFNVVHKATGDMIRTTRHDYAQFYDDRYYVVEENLTGALLHYTILDPNHDEIYVDGHQYICTGYTIEQVKAEERYIREGK